MNKKKDLRFAIEEKKVQISITLRPRVIKWIQNNVAELGRSKYIEGLILAEMKYDKNAKS